MLAKVTVFYPKFEIFNQHVFVIFNQKESKNFVAGDFFIPKTYGFRLDKTKGIINKYPYANYDNYFYLTNQKMNGVREIPKSKDILVYQENLEHYLYLQAFGMASRYVAFVLAYAI